MRVSKGWRDYIAKLPRLWQHLDLSGARKAVPRSFINKAVRCSEYRLTSVTVHRFEHVDVLQNMAKVCKNLSELELISLPHAMSATLIDVVRAAPNLRKFIVHPSVSGDTVAQIIHCQPSIQHVAFGCIMLSRHRSEWKAQFPNLNTISLQFTENRGSPGVDLSRLLACTPNLQSLTLTNTTIDSVDLTTIPLTSLVLRRIDIAGDFPVLPPTIQRVVVESSQLYDLDSNTLILLQSRLPALTHLHLTEFDGLCADRLEELLDLYHDESGKVHAIENATPLQHLTLRGLLAPGTTSLFGPDTRHGLLTHSPRIMTPALKSLDISTLPCDDDEIEHLVGHELGLTSIDLSSTNITGASIKMLTDQCKTLQVLRADNCSKINGRDAIEYAIRRGIRVNCSMGEGKGGRKIRYG